MSKPNTCDWTSGYQQKCPASCQTGTVIGGTCELLPHQQTAGDVYVLAEAYKDEDSPNWQCVFYDVNFFGQSNEAHSGISIKSTAICVSP
jgi:hypothetical protein